MAVVAQCLVEHCWMEASEPFDAELDLEDQPCWYLRERPLGQISESLEAGCALTLQAEQRRAEGEPTR